MKNNIDWVKWLMTVIVIPLVLGSYVFANNIRKEREAKLDKMAEQVNRIDKNLTEIVTIIKYKLAIKDDSNGG